MITEKLLDLVEVIIDGLMALIPDVDLSTYTTELNTFGASLGDHLGALDSFLPLSEVGVFVGWVLTIYLPVAITFHVTMWIYGKIPVIGQ